MTDFDEEFDEELFKAAEHAVVEEARIADHAPLVGAVLEAVEPLIRADERAKIHVTSTGLSGRIDYAQVRSEVLADLRAKAGKLPRRYRKEHGKWLITVDVADLTALLGGSDD